MALTLQVKQRLERVGLITFFEQTKGTWQGLAQNVYTFVKTNYPPGEAVRRDDVAQNLLPFIQVQRSLADKLGALKLKQNYWKKDFCDLVIDRCWETITGGA